MAENKYICQSCFHKGMCLEYDDECYGCPHYVNAADVAPRSEVAREIFGEIEANINALEYNARTPRKTVSVDELKAQMDWVLREVIPGTLAKIKQKYTEEQK